MRKAIKDDEIYGPIRAEICDAYIVAGKPKPERNWLYSRLVRVTLENQELETLFDMQHSRVTEATKLWQAAHDNTASRCCSNILGFMVPVTARPGRCD
jgi:hypothetical protein